MSVVIAAFADERWADLLDAVNSVGAQSCPPLETFVVIDHNEPLLERATSTLHGVHVLANSGPRGASGARNTAVAGASGDLVVFLDDDAVAAPDWLERLLTPFDDTDVIGVGGLILPIWCSVRPRWFAPEFDWVVGASFRGMPVTITPVRNVWSGNMAIRREVFDAVRGFRPGFGKTGDRSRPEDTELCVRAAKVKNGGFWAFQPNAVVHHRVPAAREHFGFFVRRCFEEGRGKAELAVLVGDEQATASERAYVAQVIPKGIAISVGEAVRGDLMGMARAGSIVVGLTAAVIGMAQGRWNQRQAGTPGNAVPSRDADANPR